MKPMTCLLILLTLVFLICSIIFKNLPLAILTFVLALRLKKHSDKIPLPGIYEKLQRVNKGLKESNFEKNK